MPNVASWHVRVGRSGKGMMGFGSFPKSDVVAWDLILPVERPPAGCTSSVAITLIGSHGSATLLTVPEPRTLGYIVLFRYSCPWRDAHSIGVPCQEQWA